MVHVRLKEERMEVFLIFVLLFWLLLLGHRLFFIKVTCFSDTVYHKILRMYVLEYF